MLGVIFPGRRYDTGDRLDYLKASILLALDRDDLGPELASWIKEIAPHLSNELLTSGCRAATAGRPTIPTARRRSPDCLGGARGPEPAPNLGFATGCASSGDAGMDAAPGLLSA